MKMHKAIGEARASTRSIFTLALVGVLLSFTGQAFGAADEKSGMCEWPDDWAMSTAATPADATDLNQWNSVTAGMQGLNDLDSVDGDTIRFRGATGAAGATTTLTALTFPAPTCDFDGDGTADTLPTTGFWTPTITCGGTDVPDSNASPAGTLITDADAGSVAWLEDGTNDGEIDLTFTVGADANTGAAAVSCVLSLDWVGSNDADGPITYAFSVGIVPTPHTAPTLVRALAESYNSVYVEWTLVTGTDTTTAATAEDDDPASYVITWTGGTPAVTRSMTVMADPNPVDETAGTQDTAKRQGARISGLMPETAYTITVAGRTTDMMVTNYGRPSAAATSGSSVTTEVAGTPIDDANRVSTVTTQKRYYKAPPPSMADDTFVLSLGESVEIDPQTYLLNLALTGRDDFNIPADHEEYAQYVRDTATFVYEVSSNTTLEAIYISTDADSQAEDLIRLKGLKEGTTNLTLMATMGMETITSTMAVKVLENHEPRFAVTEANLMWHVDKEDPMGGTHVDYEIDVMEQFGHTTTDEDQTPSEDAGDCEGDPNASDNTNCEEELTYSLSGISGATGYTSHSSYFEITEDNESTGLITARLANPENSAALNTSLANALERLEDGDEIGMTVTVTDAAGGKDTLNIILAVSTEGNFGPELAFRATTAEWLTPLSESNGGGSRSISLGRKFTDPEGDHLCYEIVTASTTLGNTTETWAEAELGRQPGQAASCRGSELTIDMLLPSTDPEDDAFPLLGKYGVETASVTVRAYELGTVPGTTRKYTPNVTVSVRLVYGTNAGPNIRAVAETPGGTFLASGAHEIDEGGTIRLTFIADDAQPNGDLLCWTAGFNCTPCKGDEPTSATRAPAGTRFSFFRPPWDSITNKTSSDSVEGSAHSYNLVVTGRYFTGLGAFRRETVRTDYERNNGVYTINVCATDLSGATDRLAFDVKLKDVKEAPVFSTPTASNDIDLFMLVGDYSQDVRARATDGDGDAVTYGAAFVGSCPGVKLETNAETGEIKVTPPTSNISDESGMMTCDVEVSATDGEHDVYSVGSHFQITVKNDNSSPEFANGLSALTFNHPENQGGTVGHAIRVVDSDTAGSGDSVSVTLSGTSNFRASSRAVRRY